MSTVYLSLRTVSAVYLSMCIVETKDKHATLTTPVLQPPPPTTPGCVTFTYHIPENSPGSLEVSTVLTSRDPQHVQPVWRVANTRTIDDFYARNEISVGQLPVTLTSEANDGNFRVSRGLCSDDDKFIMMMEMAEEEKRLQNKKLILQMSRR